MTKLLYITLSLSSKANFYIFTEFCGCFFFLMTCHYVFSIYFILYSYSDSLKANVRRSSMRRIFAGTYELLSSFLSRHHPWSQGKDFLFKYHGCLLYFFFILSFGDVGPSYFHWPHQNSQTFTPIIFIKGVLSFTHGFSYLPRCV